MIRAVLLLLAAFWLGGGNASERNAWQPDYAKLQLAGNIGLLAAGVGKRFADQEMAAEFFIGHVPDSLGGSTITTFAAKASWQLVDLPLNATAQLPIYAGLAAFYVDGLTLREGAIPAQAMHLMPFVGLELAHRYWHGNDWRAAGFYLEAGALDLLLEDYLNDDNHRYFDWYELFNLAFGLRVDF